MPNLTLYNLRGCPYCARVKSQLDRVGLKYDEIQVPPLRMMRKTVKQISGQRGVPVLVDGDRVIVDSAVICEYLSTTYGHTADNAPASDAQALPHTP